MAFEKIIVGLKKPRRQASIRLADKNASGRPRCLIALRKDFAETFGLKPNECLEVQIGTGDDEGRMRFVRASAGVAVKVGAKGGAGISLGHVPSLGSEAIEKTAVDVRLVDGNTFELTLPDAAGEARVEVRGVQSTEITIALGKSRLAKLAAAAQEADEDLPHYAARLFATVIDEDDAANSRAA